MKKARLHDYKNIIKKNLLKSIEKPLPDVFAEHGVVSTQHQNTVKNEKHALLYPSYKPNISQPD